MTRPANILAAVVLATAAIGSAAQKADKPAVTEKPAQKLQVTVVSVTGQAEKLVAGQTDKWQALKAGDKLDELSIIRTGLRSSVTLKFEDRGQTIVHSATKVGIADFHKKGNLATARLGLKYGSLSVAVDSTRAPNDVKIETPAATLSVRGTKGGISYTGGNRVVLLGEAGTWNVAAAGRSRNVRAGESTDGNLTPPINLTKQGRDSFRAVVGVTPGEKSFITNHHPPLGATGSPGDRTLPIISPMPKPPQDHITPGF